MRILLFLGLAAVVGLVVTGAITLNRSDDQKITIQIDRARVRQEAAAALEKGREAIDGAESAIRRQPQDIPAK